MRQLDNIMKGLKHIEDVLVRLEKNRDGTAFDEAILRCRLKDFKDPQELKVLLNECVYKHRHCDLLSEAMCLAIMTHILSI